LPDVKVTKVQWIVHATPGWLNQKSRTEGNFVLSIPEKFESEAYSKGVRVPVWSENWSFKAGTPVDWEITAFSTDENGSPGALIEYLLNRNIVENYRFSKSYLRSTIAP